VAIVNGHAGKRFLRNDGVNTVAQRWFGSMAQENASLENLSPKDNLYSLSRNTE
jgi:hypothetical protein